ATKDQHYIVDAGREETIDRERNRLVEEAAGDFANLITRELADRHELGRIIPLMIENRSAKLFRIPDLCRFVGVGHWPVRALGDECIEFRDASFGQDLSSRRKENVCI